MESARFDVDRLLALPRLAGLAVSRDGARLVTSVGTVAPDGKRYRSALWQLDPNGEAAPRRLTHSERGESLGGFLPDGSLLFLSSRPDPDSEPSKKSDDEGPAALWLLPADGGEAFQVAAPSGGIEGLAIARHAGTIACYVPMFPGSGSPDVDKQKGDDRKEKGVSAHLFETYPIRFWDHYLGPRYRRVAVGTVAGDGAERTVELRDLTPDAGPNLTECELDITPDGTTVVTTWRRKDYYADLVAIDVASGGRRVLAGGDGTIHIHAPACSPDGRSVAFLVETVGAPDNPARVMVWVADLATGEHRDVLAGEQIWPSGVTWTLDSSALLASGDAKGRVPVWRVDVAGEGAGRVTRLSADGSLTDVRASTDGRVFALRSLFDRAPHGAVIGDGEADQRARPLPSPGDSCLVPSRIEEMWVDAPDGRGHVHSFLFLPPDASETSPAPLVLFIHGGPFASFNGWQWRWNANVVTDHGYAVLAVNPALSTGYGWENIDRAWGTWGSVVEADLMAALDAACARPDIDDTRVAAAGGSYGGFMANWLAGHTARFRCLITHASVWALDMFHGTTDLGPWLEQEFGDPDTSLDRWLANSPQQFLAAVATHRTPTLVIHGELDVRVPISEALRLWTDLRRHDVPARFLYFPDENHWVLKPQNSRIWYGTVLAFLDEYLLGKPFERDALL